MPFPDVELAPPDRTTHTRERPAPGDRLRVGLIAPPWVAVPPPVYGGTELVIDGLARGLVEAGHDVVLFATGDSQCPVERRSVYPTALGTTAPLLSEMRQVQVAYRELADMDVIHDHTLLGPLWAIASETRVPVVTTSHGPFTAELAAHFETIAHRAAVVAISHHQRSTAPEIDVAAVIHHGIDVARLPFGAGDGGFVLFLGRMNPDKGPHRAIRAARRAGKRIVLAAKMWEPAERQYFREVVEPMLSDEAVYVGEPTVAEKLDLLGRAEALVNPIRWDEPFGLVMIEALASGTPVLAFPHGAAPEIIEDGVTGFVCADEEQMARRLGELGSLSRMRCRRAALARFSTARMVDDHLRLYRRLIEASAGSVVSLPGGRSRPVGVG